MSLQPKTITQLDAVTDNDLSDYYLPLQKNGVKTAKKMSVTAFAIMVQTLFADNILVWLIGTDVPAGNTIADNRLKGRHVKVLLVDNNPTTAGYTHNADDADDNMLDLTALGGVATDSIVIAFLDK